MKTLIFIVTFFTTAVSLANLDETMTVTKAFHGQLFDQDRCYLNINLLSQILGERRLVDLDKTMIVVAESIYNDLHLHEARAYFHVFMISDGYAIDPLSIEFRLDENGVMPIEDYLLAMFPSLKGTRYSFLSARNYLALPEDEFLGLFYAYNLGTLIPFGKRMIDLNVVSDSNIFLGFRLPLTHAMQKMRLR